MCPVSASNNKMAMIVAIFDSHFGCVVNRRIPEDPNTWEISYDFNIGKQRMDMLFNSAFAEITRRGKKEFDEIVIVIGGDNCDGDGSIFKSQIHHLEADPMRQIKLFTSALMDNAERCSHFVGQKGSVNMYGVVGNHGEMRGMPTMRPLTDNWDRNAYIWIDSILLRDQEKYNKLTNVKFLHNRAYDHPHLAFRVKGHSFLGVHALPRNLISPSSKLKLMNLEKLYPGLKIILTGHYHEGLITSAGDVRIIRVGTPVGPNDYSDELLIYSSGPEQALVVVAQENPLVSYIPVQFGV